MSRQIPWVVGACAAGVLLLASPALAQSTQPQTAAPPVTLREVVVSGRHEPANMLERESTSGSRLGLTVRETPATVDVITAEELRGQGLRTVTEAAQGATGVIAGDFPAEPAAFSMRGFAGNQISTLYDGIRIGPANMTSRVVTTGHLARIEFLKGAASLMSGEGATGGAINLVPRRPHSGPAEHEVHLTYGSFGSLFTGFGSGGSTPVAGLNYRFDLSRADTSGFVDDTRATNWHLSSGLDWRGAPGVKLWGAFEYRKDDAKTSWGVPLVPVTVAGANATRGIVSGTHVSNYNGTNLGAVTVDDRTLRTNYNVLDNRTNAEETWLRGGFEWAIATGMLVRNQLYWYGARREWFNNEITAFNADTGLVDRERFYVAHRQSLVGDKAEWQWDEKLAGRDNRLIIAAEWSRLDFRRPGAANFPGDSVSLLAPERGTYGLLTTQQQTAVIDTAAIAIEDRLRITPSLALITGLRHESITLDRTSTNVAGADRAGFPFSTSWRPTTGRAGLVLDATPDLMLYGQYGTGADVSANNIFLLGPAESHALTRARTLEGGFKQRFADRQGLLTFALFDMTRSNVYAAQGGQQLALAGELRSKGAELAAAFNARGGWRLFGNVAYTHARYRDWSFAGGSSSGNTPPNVPAIIANAGGSIRFNAFRPWEAGLAIRHVGDRWHSDANTVKLEAYTVADAFIAVQAGREARVTLRVRNVTDRRYAAWSDPFYPDQILLGAPRGVELGFSASFR